MLKTVRKYPGDPGFGLNEYVTFVKMYISYIV